jgi:hypothetical protein
VKDTNLQPKFLLQVQKQQEDSAILLASIRPQHKDKTKNRSTEMEKQNFKGKDNREKTKNTIFFKAGSNNQIQQPEGGCHEIVVGHRNLIWIHMESLKFQKPCSY